MTSVLKSNEGPFFTPLNSLEEWTNSLEKNQGLMGNFQQKQVSSNLRFCQFISHSKL